MSETKLPGVYKKINAVSSNLAKKGFGKDATNTFDKYDYRSIDGLYTVLGGELAECGLLILPNVIAREVTEKKSQQNKSMFTTFVQVEYTFIDPEDGSSHKVVAYGEAADRSDKSLNKAMSFAYKNMAFQSFCIPLVGDDPDAETPEVNEWKPEAMIAGENLEWIRAAIKNTGQPKDKLIGWLNTEMFVKRNGYRTPDLEHIPSEWFPEIKSMFERRAAKKDQAK